jgi:hypothetical protein
MSAHPHKPGPLGTLLAPLLVMVLTWWDALAAWLNPADAVENLADWQYEALCFVMRILGFLLIVALVVSLALLHAKGALTGGAR